MGQVHEEADTAATGAAIAVPLAAHLAVLVALAAVCFFVHWPDRVDFIRFDDVQHLANVRRVQTGEMSFAHYLWKPHNEHWIPLFRLWFYGHWRCFGLESIPWRISMLAIHTLSAWLVYGLLVRWWGEWLAAAFIAAAWAGTSARIGIRLDSPLVWVAAAHLSMGLVGILAAAYFSSPLSAGGRGGRLSASATCLCLGYLAMGSLVLLMAPLLVVALACKPVWNAVWSRPWGWAIAWLLPTGMAGIIGVLLAKPSGADPWDVIHGTEMAFDVMFVSLSELLVFTDLVRERSQIGLLVALALFVVIALRRDRRELAPVAVVLLLSAFAYTWIACYTRSDISAAKVLSWSRYRYIPTLAWLLTIGSLLAKVLLATNRRLPWQLAIAGWLAVYLAANAIVIRRDFAHFVHDAPIRRQMAIEMVQAVHAIGAAGNARGQPYVLPSSITQATGLPLSFHAVIFFPDGIDGITIVADEEFSEGDRQAALAVLGTIDNRIANAMRIALEHWHQRPPMNIPAFP